MDGTWLPQLLLMISVILFSLQPARTSQCSLMCYSMSSSIISEKQSPKYPWQPAQSSLILEKPLNTLTLLFNNAIQQELIISILGHQYSAINSTAYIIVQLFQKSMTYAIHISLKFSMNSDKDKASVHWIHTFPETWIKWLQQWCVWR